MLKYLILFVLECTYKTRFTLISLKTQASITQVKNQPIQTWGMKEHGHSWL